MSRRTLFTIASVLLTLGLVGGSSTASIAKPRPPYKVSIEASATTVPVGGTIVFSGKVKPATQAARKQSIKLQITYPDGLFETAALGKINRKGKYEFTWQASVPGTHLIRVRIAAGKGHSEGISEELTITVTP
jgi:hypothetical protein